MRGLKVAMPLLLLVLASGQAVFLTQDQVLHRDGAQETAAAHAAAASTIEDLTTQIDEGLTYQHDVKAPGDAPDTCADVDPARAVTPGGELAEAELVEFDDESDVIWSDTHLQVGGRVSLDVLDEILLATQTLAFDVFAPDCSFSVFDETAPIYQSISPEAGDGEKIVRADLSAACRTSKDYWKFHISGAAPSEIYVEWTNGAWERRSFVDGNDGLGNYITTANTGYDLRVAEAVVPDGWNGNFDLIQRPCDTVDGGAEPVERVVPAPLKGDRYAEWEARYDHYVIQVTIAKGAVDTLTSTPSAPALPGMRSASSPATCDDSYCASLIGFDLKMGSVA